jgi:flagellar protein FlaG
MAISSINPVAGGDVWQMSQAAREQVNPQQTAVLQTAAVAAPGVAVNTSDANNAGSMTRQEAVALQQKQVQQALKSINQNFEMLSVGVQFELDSDYKNVIIKVIDRENGKVIRQIPSEEMVRFAKEIDKLKGLLIEQTA